MIDQGLKAKTLDSLGFRIGKDGCFIVPLYDMNASLSALKKFSSDDDVNIYATEPR